MIDWEFILNPDTPEQMVIDEPVGWADIQLEIVRDKRNHGISIAYSLNSIKLVGEAAQFLIEQNDLYGVDAAVIIRITALCDGEEQYEEDFKLDFGRYEELCGEECSVSIGIEQISCFVDFNNNFDKKVDMRSQVAFDGTTPLEQYDGLEKEMTIPAKALKLQDRAETEGEVSYELHNDINWPCNGCTNDSWDGYLLPPLPLLKYSSFGSFQYSSSVQVLRGCGGNNHPPYPDDVTINSTELLSGIECELSDLEMSFRLKGAVAQAVSGAGNPGILLRVKIFKLSVGDDGGDCGSPGDWVELFSSDLIDTRGLGSGTHPFDVSGAISTPIVQGDLIHFGCYFAVTRVSQISSCVISFTGNAENFFDAQTGALCEDTTAKTFMVYESLARIAESITNKCMKIKSNYFGRTDSEPEVYNADGCGALETLTTGLYLRKATNPTFFISMKELIAGLQAIHNIGFGLTVEGVQETMRIEPAEFFYQNVLLFDCTDADLVKKKTMAEEIAGTILGGYEKWEIENVNGLDEFNSKREFRLTIKNAKTPFDYRCKFIAGGYAIEITRQQSFAESGAADTKYDNDTFILCLDRDIYGYAYPNTDFIVEQGGITDDANMFDPDTVINFRISPIRNMMRLAKLFTGAYRDHEAAASVIKLQSGDGNLLAEGFIDNDDCTPEAHAMSESDDISVSDFAREEDARPILRPESITFDYPMSLADFKKIKTNPYGYILHSCGGELQKAHIMKIVYRPNAGRASLELRNRYE